MLTASAAAIVVRPKAPDGAWRPAFQLDSLVPREFDGWREVPEQAIVVNPQQQELLDRLYHQLLTRTYESADGYRIMLSLAYGGDQRERGALRAHKPEVCYPAQGFVIERSAAAVLRTDWGDIPVQRLYATMAARREPVTYWFTVGDTAVGSRWQKRLIDLRYGLTGRVPDGLLFRVSSLDADAARAYRAHDAFVAALLGSASPADRKRLSGLGGARDG